MTPINTQQSAKIIKFPVGGRQGFEQMRAGTAVLPPKRAVNVAWDAWYHQEAINADDTPKQ